MKRFLKPILIIGLLTLAILALKPNSYLRLGNFFKPIEFRQGLDLAGGTRLIYELETESIPREERKKAVQGVVNVIERRTNLLGVSEPVISQTSIDGKDAVTVELPGVKDVESAIKTIGQTALLEFQEPNDTDQDDGVSNQWRKTSLTGTHLVRAQVEFPDSTQANANGPSQIGRPVVSLTFDAQGTKLFKEITTRNLQKPVAIVLDDQIISAPTVQSIIENGRAIISGSFDINQAKLLALELNAGALPVEAKLIAQTSVGATLGEASVKNSITAGVVSIIMVIGYISLYYRARGVIASIALIIYILLLLALIKFIPVTLTLAVIAGLVLSIGAAVDANVLIFERIKEEEASGRPKTRALALGFALAWPSIRDSNVSSLIIAAVLFSFGTGLVRGFALMLAIGILVSMFSAITITQTMLNLSLIKPRRSAKQPSYANS